MIKDKLTAKHFNSTDSLLDAKPKFRNNNFKSRSISNFLERQSIDFTFENSKEIVFLPGTNKVSSATAEALIDYTCGQANPEAAEVWVYTYRSFMTAADCITLLLARLRACSTKFTKKRIRTGALLIRVVADLSPYEIKYENELSETLISVIHSLIFDGDVTVASKLRKVFIGEVKKAISKQEVLEEKSFLVEKVKRAVTILQISPQNLAEELTMIQQSMFDKIEIGELLARAKNAKDEQKFMKFAEFVDNFNQTSYRIRAILLLQEKRTHRHKVYSLLCETASWLKSIGNLNGMYCVFSALNSPAVQQLGPWPKQSEEILTGIDNLMSPNGNYKNYREFIDNWHKPYIPWFGVITQQLISIAEVNDGCIKKAPDLDDKKMINFLVLTKKYEALKPWKHAARQKYNYARHLKANHFFTKFSLPDGKKYSDDYFWNLAMNILRFEKKKEKNRFF